MAGKKVGILALQGAFIEHAQHIKTLGHVPIEIRLPEELNSIDSLIIPGGESTTIGKLARNYSFTKPIQDFAKTKPIWGTCAGLIYLAKEVDSSQETLGLVDITVRRNAFGRQIDSFIENLEVSGLDRPFQGVFIRAPIISEVEPAVAILAKLRDGRIVAAKQNNILCTCFHPELTEDLRLHQYFLNM